MDPVLGVALLGAVGASIVAAFFRTDARRRRRRDRAWDIAATKLGITRGQSVPGNPKLSGSIDGFATDVWLHTTPASSRQDWVTTYEIAMPPGLPPFRVVARRAFISTDVLDQTTGDPGFDSRLVVDSEFDWASRLRESLRREIVELFETHFDVVMTGETLRATRAGYETDAATLIETTRRLVRIAKSLVAAL